MPCSSSTYSSLKLQQDLDALFYPCVRVIPQKDWSSIKAIWIPFLHHDYQNQLQRAKKITILEQKVDKFGTIQGYLLARNENYLPYLTTFFNPLWSPEHVIENIVQAHANIIETQIQITNSTTEKAIRTTVIGAAQSNMLISITKNIQGKIIDAFPIFYEHATYHDLPTQEEY